MTDLERLASRAQNFKTLKLSPAWQELQLAVKEKLDGQAAILGRNLLSGEPLDQSDIDYWRGFVDGARFVLDDPEKVEKRLESALRRERNK